VERFNPAVRKLQEVVAHGWLGDPIHFSFTRVGGYPDHVVNKKNVLLDLAVHDLDIFQLFANPVTINACLCHSTFQENIFDTAEILARGKNGISGSIHVNWVTPTKIRSVRVTGTRGVCLVDYMLQTCTLLGGLLLGARSEPRTEFSSLIEAYKNSDRIEFGVAKEEPLRLELDAFYHALNGQPSHLCTGKEGALLTAMVEDAIGLFQRTAVAAI
jgi:UDP-N-acetylglucosamine 3-dehydrogenase